MGKRKGEGRGCRKVEHTCELLREGPSSDKGAWRRGDSSRAPNLKKLIIPLPLCSATGLAQLPSVGRTDVLI